MTTTQLPLLRFDGRTYVPSRDGERLSTQYRRTFDLMRDGRWRTLAEIAYVVEGGEPAVSARLRDMRKKRFGSHTVNRRYREKGVWEYQLVEAKL